MLTRNLRRVANRVSTPLMTGKRAYSSFDRDFDILTSAMTRDLERSFHRRLAPRSPWDFFGRSPSFFYEPTAYYRQPVHSTYEQKTITSDENGRVRVQTQRKVSGQPWETYVEEYVNNDTSSKKAVVEETKKPEAISQSAEAENSKTAKSETADHQATTTSTQSAAESSKTTEATATATAPTSTSTSTTQNAKDQTISTQSPRSANAVNTLSLFDQHFQQLSNTIMRDFDDFFTTRQPFFNTPRWFEPAEMDMQEIDGNTTYHAETVINDNGRVSVKTVSKKPGSAWETTVKHYGKDGAVERGQQKVEAISDAGKAEQKGAQEVEQSAEKEQKNSTEQTNN